MIRLVPTSNVPLTSRVTWKTRLRDWARESGYRLLNAVGVPGVIRDTTYRDELTGHTVTVRIGLYYTLVTVDGRDFYFHRLTGKLDGTGHAVCPPGRGAVGGGGG